MPYIDEMSNKVPWKLWVDDMCYMHWTSRACPINYHAAPSSEIACMLVKMYGIPEEMCLDYMLSDSDTIMNFLEWLKKYCADNNITDIPRTTCHSDSREGRAQVKEFIRSWQAGR